MFAWSAVCVQAMLCEFSPVFQPICKFCSEEVYIFENRAAHLAQLKFAEQAEGDSPQSAVSLLISVPQRRAVEMLW